MPLPPDSTIETVYASGLLAYPADYTRVILERMKSYRFIRRSALVRIDVGGSGEFPNYRVEPRTDDDVTAPSNGHSAYRGRNHALLEPAAVQKVIWSTAVMSFEQVQALLGRIRSFPPERL
jgi:hypothetical protein